MRSGAIQASCASVSGSAVDVGVAFALRLVRHRQRCVARLAAVARRVIGSLPFDAASGAITNDDRDGIQRQRHGDQHQTRRRGVAMKIFASGRDVQLNI